MKKTWDMRVGHYHIPNWESGRFETIKKNKRGLGGSGSHTTHWLAPTTNLCFETLIWNVGLFHPPFHFSFFPFIHQQKVSNGFRCPPPPPPPNIVTPCTLYQHSISICVIREPVIQRCWSHQKIFDLQNFYCLISSNTKNLLLWKWVCIHFFLST